jgi:hypothetical protein
MQDANVTPVTITQSAARDQAIRRWIMEPISNPFD